MSAIRVNPEDSTTPETTDSEDGRSGTERTAHPREGEVVCRTETHSRSVELRSTERWNELISSVLARQPGPEVAEQLSIYQETLKAKTKQLKSLASEVNMYESHIDEYKYEIDKLNRQLTEVRQKYFIQKKKETVAKERDRLQQNQQLTTTINGITLQQPPPDLIQPNRSK